MFGSCFCYVYYLVSLLVFKQLDEEKSGLLYFMLPMSYDYKCYAVLPHGAVCWSQFVIVDMSCIKLRGSHHNANNNKTIYLYIIRYAVFCLLYIQFINLYFDL